MSETRIVSVTGQVLFCGDGDVRTVLVEAVRSGADLARANLAEANLIGADLARANLIGANLIGAYLAGADLGGANLARAYLAGAYLAGAYLGGANLARANLARAYLAGANLAEANLIGADLAGADLGGANLAEADLGGANLAGADLIDGGQDQRGYRFWAWRRADGQTIFRAGCRQWASLEGALAHYRSNYRSDGDVEECVARLRFLADEAESRGWSVRDAADLGAGLEGIE